MKTMKTLAAVIIVLTATCSGGKWRKGPEIRPPGVSPEDLGSGRYIVAGTRLFPVAPRRLDPA